MSATKRLAKRSIIGTRISALSRETGLYVPGLIINCKNPDEFVLHNCNTGVTPNSRYTVRFETGESREFGEAELVGPGFGNVASLKLRPGQKTFVTHNGREVTGTVVYHRPQIDEVLINIQSPGTNELPFDVTKKLDEVRLLESRKSARLQEQDTTDFARLADVSDRKRNQQTASIDVPRSTNMSRKRRPSSGNQFQPLMALNGDEVLDECAAAMVLMSLSCSPHSPQWDNNGTISSSWSSSSSGASSWLSANGSSGPANSNLSASVPIEMMHYNNCSPTPSSSDDGIDSDTTTDWDEPRKKKTKLIFKCTWPGCSMVKEACFDIEAHVRYAHLGPATNEGSGDHEEEFYYTEEEVPDLSSLSSSFSGSLGMAFSPTLSHMDMVRPPSEDPEYKLLQRKSPSGNTHLKAAKLKLSSPKASPVRRPRGETKKCRKVYGMERRDQWCTQCKWKKACTRFGE